ncbi:hypothetical protein KCU61_g537, partial [Aureobasidium melanogenum]
MKRCKTIPSQTLMPIRKVTRAVQGTAEYIMLLAQAFADSVERHGIYMGYSTYAYEALTRNIHALQSDYTVPSFNLESSYNHNGGVFSAWNDYLDTKCNRTATNSKARARRRRPFSRR